MKKTTSKKILAINGGTPVMKKMLPEVHNVTTEEIAAVKRVVDSGSLSGFLGAAGKRFLGGREVKAFEVEFAKKFKVKHAVAMNSATTALHAAIVALGIGPGDEVIVSPYTMSASAICALMNGAVPVFADVDGRTFNVDPKSVEQKITKRTKAIMVVNLFGQPVDFDAILKLAKKHKLKVIEDNAQGPGAKWGDKFCGTIGDVGVFSLNVHKTIQTGEGGVLVTNNDSYAFRAQLCRNHGEIVATDTPGYDAGPIIGTNYRMSEVIAAMARVQLKRLDMLTKKRLALVKYLEAGLKKMALPGVSLYERHPKAFSVFYRYPLLIDASKLGISRNRLVEAMLAEGFGMSKGYVTPVYLLNVFQERKAFNNTHFPFEYEGYSAPSYRKGICPVVEELWEKKFTLTDICQHPYTKQHVDLFLKALKKVYDHKDEL